jgi:hypothetical protein
MARCKLLFLVSEVNKMANENIKTWPETLYIHDWKDRMPHYEDLSCETIFDDTPSDNWDAVYIRADIAKEREEKLIFLSERLLKLLSSFDARYSEQEFDAYEEAGLEKLK